MDQNLTKNNANCQISVAEIALRKIFKGVLPIERLRDTELVKLCVTHLLVSHDSQPFVRNALRGAAKVPLAAMELQS